MGPKKCPVLFLIEKVLGVRLAWLVWGPQFLKLSLKNFVGVLGTSLTLAKEYTGSSGLDGFL